MGVVVMGVGFCGSFPTSTGLSYREMIARAAAMAYQDAGVPPEQVDGAVSVEEDFMSGYSIADEYTPDQLGMVRKPMYTVPGDFLQGLASAVMQVRTGRFKAVVVSSYSKASNMLTKDELTGFAFDPVFNRFGVSPHFLAGLEMQRFLATSPYEIDDIADVAVRNRTAGLSNPLAPYSMPVDATDVLSSRTVASPLTELMLARPADGAVVVVVGDETYARDRARKPVRISGCGWASGNMILERRDHGSSVGTRIAATMAYAEADIELPEEQIDIAYVSDTYAYRQLMHLESLQLSRAKLPFTNPDGGAQSMGDLFEATSGVRLYDAVRQLRGEAGTHQVEEVECALVQGWRGVPTDTCAVVVLEQEGR